MLNALPNFGGSFAGTTYSATGRLTAIAIDPTIKPSRPAKLFVGAAAGGVWMSKNGGKAFKAIGDALPTQAIGAIAIDPGTKPPTVYVATGEGNGGESYYGEGIFKSADGGKNWVAAGSLDRVAIARLAVVPSHGATPATLFAAAGGGSSASRALALLGESDRSKFGLWRSTDGGADWSQYGAGVFDCQLDSTATAVPSGAVGTGAPCAAKDVVVDPTNPLNVYAAIKADGVFVSTNGGDTFAKACFTNDQPNCTFPSALNQMDRASIAVLDGTVYVMVGAKSSSNEYVGFFKSTDGGGTWSERTVPSWHNPNGSIIDGTSDKNSSQESYDQALAIAPGDPTHNTVFFGGIGIYESTDGGQSWSFLASKGGTHADQHAIAIAPDNKTVFIGNDGGLYSFRIDQITNTGGSATASFTPLNDKLPVGQIQTVAPHPQDTKLLLAGFQDNGTQRYTGSPKWQSVETGDGGFVLFDQTNHNLAYHTFFAFGNRQKLRFGFSTDSGSSWADTVIDLSAQSPPDPGLSFYPPMAADPQVANRVLLGGHHVWVLTFDQLSPDVLFADVSLQSAQDLNPGCSDGHCALVDIEVLPSSDAVAWAVAGSNSQLPTPSGFRVYNTTQANCPDQPACGSSGTPQKLGAWNDVTGNLPFSTTQTQVTGIAIDPFDTTGHTAYLTLSGFTAATGIGHIFKTTDFGQTWVPVDGTDISVSPLPDIPVLRLIVDRTDSTSNSLWVATDVGVFRSTDGGGKWSAIKGVLPTVPVFDIEQSQTGALFIGTHGRGAWRLR